MGMPARNQQEPGTPLEGAVHSTTIPNLFHELGERRATGVLTVTGTPGRRTVTLRDGIVQFATSTNRDDRFSQILLKSGVIPLKSLLHALDLSLATRDRLGEVMIRKQMLSQAEINKWVKVQVREIVCDLFNGTTGHWSFEETSLPAESITLGLTGDAMAIEGIRQISSWARVYEEVGGLNAEYLATRRMAEITKGLPLLTEERQLLARCDEPTSLGEMCDGSRMGDFQVCRSVWGLLVVGALMKS
jgi:uncharacterized protein DUF4388